MSRIISTPIAGQLLRYLVRVGDTVSADTEIAIVESMKMHIPVAAEASGKVAKLLAAEATTLAEGQPLLALEG